MSRKSIMAELQWKLEEESFKKRIAELFVEISSLKEKNAQLEEQLQIKEKINLKLVDENERLEQKVAELQGNLCRTMEFYNQIRKSKFKRIFWGKKLKALPAPKDATI